VGEDRRESLLHGRQVNRFENLRAIDRMVIPLLGDHVREPREFGRGDMTGTYEKRGRRLRAEQRLESLTQALTEHVEGRRQLHAIGGRSAGCVNERASHEASQ
jgi:hypothetical protein